MAALFFVHSLYSVILFSYFFFLLFIFLRKNTSRLRSEIIMSNSNSKVKGKTVSLWQNTFSGDAIYLEL